MGKVVGDEVGEVSGVGQGELGGLVRTGIFFTV